MKVKHIVSILISILIILNACRKEPIQDPAIEAGSINIISGNNQKGDLEQRLKDSIVVLLLDKDKLPVQGAKLQFTVISGGGSISNQVVKSNYSGKASVAWTLGIGPEQILKVALNDFQEANPVYLYANSQFEIETKWIKDNNFYAYGVKYDHDNRILESSHFLTFSDGASDDVKVIYSKMAEESFFELKQLFNILTNEELIVNTSNTANKIKIYSIKNANYEQLAYRFGFVLFGQDSPDYQRWQNGDFWFRREIKHETMHVIQWLFGLDFPTPGWTDTWFTEGIAEYVSGGAFAPITSLNQWNSWISTSGNINPVKIHEWENFPDPNRAGYYYPAFGLAIWYLLDSKGLGKNYDDVKALFRDITRNGNFSSSFEKHMGISLSYYEEHFNELITEFLKKIIMKEDEE